jgi:hypothetical protein
LSEKIPCNRDDIDFLLHQRENSFCIYDVAKGGAGYANKLGDIPFLYRALDTIRQQLSDDTLSINEILSRTTKRYYDDIDFERALTWLKIEKESRIDTDDLSKKLGDKQVSLITRQDMINAICNAANAQDLPVLFMRYASDFNYNRRNTVSWMSNNKNIDNHSNICFVEAPDMVPNDIYTMLQAINPQGANRLCSVSEEILPEGLYPLAKTGDRYYFTDQQKGLIMNADWANGRIFAVEDYQTTEITQYNPSRANDSYVVRIAEKTQINSNQLLTTIQQNNDMITNFMHTADGSQLDIKYTDKHLKSRLGMIIALQFINEILDLAPNSQYNIEFTGQDYEEYNGHDGILSSYVDSIDRDDALRELAGSLFQNGQISVHSIERIPQHYRDLVISFTDADNAEHKLVIMPDGGFQNGWYIDKEETRQNHVYYSRENTNAETMVPIISTNSASLLFHIFTE